MKTISQLVSIEIKQRPLLRVLLSTDFINIKAIARDIRPNIERTLGVKVGVETIATTLHREINNLKMYNTNSLFSRPNVRLLTTYHNLVAINYPRGYTGAEIIPDGIRYFVQTTGSNEHTIIISEESLSILDTAQAIGRIDNLISLCLGLPDKSYDIETLYARIFLYFGLQGVVISEVVSTFNELTIIIKQDDYERSYALVQELSS